MRRVNLITWDLLQGQWFLKDIKPEDKGKTLNILSTADYKWNEYGVFIDKNNAIHKKVRIR